MTPRRDQCHRCRSPLPDRPPELTASHRLCDKCAVLSEYEMQAVERDDARRRRPWTADEYERVVMCARAFVRIVPPSGGPWNREWNALIDALDRTGRKPTDNPNWRKGVEFSKDRE